MKSVLTVSTRLQFRGLALHTGCSSVGPACRLPARPDEVLKGAAGRGGGRGAAAPVMSRGSPRVAAGVRVARRGWAADQELLPPAQVSLGFNPERVLSGAFGANHCGGTATGALAWLSSRQVAHALRWLPGVQAVGGVTTLPLSSNYSTGTFRVEGRPPDPGEATWPT